MVAVVIVCGGFRDAGDAAASVDVDDSTKPSLLLLLTTTNSCSSVVAYDCAYLCASVQYIICSVAFDYLFASYVIYLHKPHTTVTSWLIEEMHRIPSYT